MNRKRFVATVGALVLGAATFLPAAAQPASVAVMARVADQSCINGDTVAVTLTARSMSTNPPVTFQWDFTNDGTLDTGVRPRPAVRHAYPDEATFTARVVATDAAGATAEDTVTFQTIRCR